MIRLFIKIFFMFALVACSINRKQFEEQKSKIVNGMVVYSFVGEKVYEIKDVYVIINDKTYRFLGDRIYNKSFNNKVTGNYYNKSPFDYTKSDSVYNLFLSNELKLRKESVYTYKFGNHNFYNYNNDLLMCFNAKMKINLYKETQKLSENIVFDTKTELGDIIVLDSIIKIDNINRQQLTRYKLKKNNISYINICFCNDILFD